ncbi:YidX family protein [Acinetobacter larvae]|uniref:Uncharacterized protein n=1 Tax=Acinetobacter larvae TaxID=1789224 RepID=A0A1B2M1D1_9GAMM|nr:hypothetical protein [Acinetobacter larvae]AOA59004.1 hypothetical protein BFG52_12015 [Acinetobacter larvae]
MLHLKNKLFAAAFTIAGVTLTGCATSTLIKSDSGAPTTRMMDIELIQDQVVAFGKPAQQLTGLPAQSVVIAGQKQSYILTKGGQELLSLLSILDPKYVSLKRELRFFAPQNDGQFSGSLKLSYVRLKQDLRKQDLDLFLQHNAEECSSSRDRDMDAQRFCFNIDLNGVVYPVVNNLAQLKPLSKPYQVSIYTRQNVTIQSNQELKQGARKLVLFPFAVAFDVVTLPFQAIQKIFD